MFSTVLGFLVVVSHIFLILALVYFILFKNKENDKLIQFVEGRALLLAFLITLFATLGSFIYSNIIGFTPCVLCWWQRIFLFPQLIILGIALKNKFEKIASYVLPLSILGALVALYHIYISFGFHSIIPCATTIGETSCVVQYVNEFGYVTIPVMSLTIFIYLIILQVALYKKNK